MFLKFGIASNEIIMRIVLGKSENLQNKGYRRSGASQFCDEYKYLGQKMNKKMDNFKE